jgi:hypothetical protein
MVYDWDGKREICYQMYIKDRKALEEIMEYMRDVYQFSPRFVFSLASLTRLVDSIDD